MLSLKSVVSQIIFFYKSGNNYCSFSACVAPQMRCHAAHNAHSLLSVILQQALISSCLTYVHVGVLDFHENAPLSPRSMTMRGLDRG